MTSPSDHRLRSVRASTQQRGVRRGMGEVVADRRISISWEDGVVGDPRSRTPCGGGVTPAAARSAAASFRGSAAHDHRWRRERQDHIARPGDGGRIGPRRCVVPVRDVPDRSGDRLLGGVLAACAAELGAEVEADDVDPLDRLNELVLGASPRQVCLVVDDVHVLGKSEALEQLIDALPANGHLLASGRATPAFSTARLDAAGQLEEIRQDELLLYRRRSHPVRQSARCRRRQPRRRRGVAGVRGTGDGRYRGTSCRYLDEEALAGLSLDRRRHLAGALFVGGGGDDEICRAVTGVSLEALVKDLPLVRWSGEHAQLHDLWGELLATELGDDDRSAAAVAAAAVVRRRRATSIGRSIWRVRSRLGTTS